jgi:catechol 2,3-dioxygenase-like lactoylglutathione lyase family enzyme
VVQTPPREDAMSSTEVRSDQTNDPVVERADMKLETIVLPVSDVDRAKEFYEGLGWRLDADIAGGALRLLQFTPPGSGCSIQFGTGLTSAGPGTAECLLVVSDIEAAHADLVDHGFEPSEVFHDASGGYNRFDPDTRASGPDPQRRTYASFMELTDPDGNVWQFQEITSRLPGRVDPATTTYSSVADVAGALRRASAAHGEHEARIGQADENWPDWYAAYMVAEQSGAELPQ